MRALRTLLPAALLLTAPGLAACAPDGGDAGDEHGAVATAAVAPVAAVDLAVGDCLTGLVIGASERTEVDAVQVIPCSSEHDLEVFAAFDLQDPGRYPGEQRVVSEADAGCTTRFTAVRASEGEDEGVRLGVLAVWPTHESWVEGDRTVACVAYAADGVRLTDRTLASA